MKRKPFLALVLIFTFLSLETGILHTSAAEQKIITSDDFIPIRAGPNEDASSFIKTEQKKEGHLPKNFTDESKTEKMDGSMKNPAETNTDKILSDDKNENEPPDMEKEKRNRESEGENELPPEKEKSGHSPFPKPNQKPTEPAQKIMNPTEGLLVRSGPGTDYEAIGSLSKNEPVTFLSDKDGWSEIIFQGANAWVKSEYLHSNENTQENPRQEQNAEEQTKERNEEDKRPKPPAARDSVIIKTSLLNVRDRASLNGSLIIGKVREGEIFTIHEEINNWLKIEFKHGHFGWIAGWHGEKRPENSGGKKKRSSVQQQAEKSRVAIPLYDGINIREQPNFGSRILKRAYAKDRFIVLAEKGDWVEIRLENGERAYIAGWLVSFSANKQSTGRKSKGNTLHNKRIVIDPGHGGKDDGATGTRGTKEKTLNLRTGLILSEKLRKEGADVILTRSSDRFIPLPLRVEASQKTKADAYISIHFDSTTDSRAGGITSYYYHPGQRALAAHIHRSLSEEIDLRDRGVRFGDYYVLRENEQASVLLELGYLSNPQEEAIISTRQYQDQACDAIVQGLKSYFEN